MSILSLEQFWHSPAQRLLAYPSGDEELLVHRWAELQTFDIDSIYSHGPATLAGLEILGLGYCGIVLRMRHQGTDRVLKIRRAPAPQESLHMEADMLARANTVDVGPSHIAHSDNFLLMEYLDGPMLVDWLQDSPPVEEVHHIVSQLIQQAYRLDQAGLDHGDLRCITAHTFVQSQEPVIIDFSKASLGRRPANVTTLVQGLFISTHIAQLLRPWFPGINSSVLIDHLRRYKHHPSWAVLQSLIAFLGLD